MLLKIGREQQYFKPNTIFVIFYQHLAWYYYLYIIKETLKRVVLEELHLKILSSSGDIYNIPRPFLAFIPLLVMYVLQECDVKL